MLPLLLFALSCGLPDRGIYDELLAQVSLQLPDSVDARDVWLRVDRVHHVLTLYERDQPLKAYPMAVAAADAADFGLRPADLAEVRAHSRPDTPVRVAPPSATEDHDGDGLVNRLDILVGARKLLSNKARYVEHYVRLAYPGGDVPRDEGVCTDTVIRSLRNAGIDLQKEVHEDIARAPRSYPMVDKVDASINHRRVKTLLPWFLRHFDVLPAGAPYRPGDVVFLDTFPSKSGPEHLGVVSDRPGSSGLPLVINNWTVGYTDSEMDLLPVIPVTHHFRAPAPAPDVAPR